MLSSNMRDPHIFFIWGNGLLSQSSYAIFATFLDSKQRKAIITLTNFESKNDYILSKKTNISKEEGDLCGPQLRNGYLNLGDYLIELNPLSTIIQRFTLFPFIFKM